MVNTPSLSFTVTPAPTSGSSTGFVYVDYEDYDEYSADDNLSVRAGARAVVKTTTAAPSTQRKTTTPTPTAPFTVPGVPSEGHTTAPVKLSTVPAPPTPMSVGPDAVIAATSSPNTTSGGTQPPAQFKLLTTEPTATSSPPPFFRLSKKDNNSVDEVSYRIVGLDGGSSKGQQSYFVPQMPPVRERTQNKRIQQLLNEKRRRGVPTSRSRESRTGERL